MTKLFSALVKDKETKQKVFIENKEYNNKQDFIKDLKNNGYAVNPDKVKRSEVFDYIVNNTNMNPWDWKRWDIDKNGNIINVEYQALK